MGKREPKPIPTMLRRLHGNPRQHRMPENEPESVGDLWDPPVWFDDEQREQWRHVNNPGGERSRAVWVVACCEYARAVVQVRSMGQVVKTKDGNAIQNPYLRS